MGWNGVLTGMSVNVVRRVSDGGGLGTAVQLTDVSGNFSRRLAKRLRVNLSGGYSLNDYNVIGGTGTGSATYVNGAAGFNYEIAHNLSLGTTYWYVHQTMGQGVLPLAAADHNRVEVGLRYTFARVLGR